MTLWRVRPLMRDFLAKQLRQSDERRAVDSLAG
jgi:hypothetical protein